MEKETGMSDEKFEKIMESLVELRNDLKHLTQRVDTRTKEIEILENRVANLEVKFAVSDQQVRKNATWIDYVFKGVITIFVGFVAVRLGLK